jgi:hypothetical protein
MMIVVQNSGIRIEAFDPLRVKNLLYVHTGHMRTQLRREMVNTHLSVSMGQTPEWCERGQLRSHTG